MKVLVIGGTGFLGYHAIRLFLARGHEVQTLALPPLPADGLLPPEVEIRFADLTRLDDGEVRDLLVGRDALVFAAGADDRVNPKRPAYRFFYEANVRSCARLFRLAREAGVRRGVILGSYFAYFDRMWPEMRLSERHPYIWSRCEQERMSLEAAAPDLDLMILELPYIFGAMPGRLPMWAPLVRYVASSFPLFYTAGGTNMIAVERVAEAIVGAIERGTGGETYVVGDENLTWKEFLDRLGRIIGRKRRVITVSSYVARLGAWYVHLRRRVTGLDSGLDMPAFVDVQTRETYFDPAPSRAALGYGSGGLDEALRATVDACLPGRR